MITTATYPIEIPAGEETYLGKISKTLDLSLTGIEIRYRASNSFILEDLSGNEVGTFPEIVTSNPPIPDGYIARYVALKGYYIQAYYYKPKHRGGGDQIDEFGAYFVPITFTYGGWFVYADPIEFSFSPDGTRIPDLTKSPPAVVDHYLWSLAFTRLSEFPAAYTVTEADIYIRKKPYTKSLPVATLGINPPCYRDLVTGYSLDERVIPDKPVLISNATKTIKIKYYQQNKLESIPDLKSICWRVYECNLVKDVAYTLPITDCVLGTLYSDDAAILAQVSSLSVVAGSYEWSDLLPSAITGLFANWNSLYIADNPNPTSIPVFTQTIKLRKLAANNNAWNNSDLTLNVDINPDPLHPMYAVDNDRAYVWHIAPQGVDPVTKIDKGKGTLLMDSPRIIETHAALEASKYAVNDIDPTKPRVANLGHLIQRIASLLAYRPLADGTFKKEDEKKLVKTVIGSKEILDPTKIGVNNFASDGMVMRRLNNSFTKDKITADECVIVHDLPQILAEYQDQINLSLGLQESSAIEIKDKDETARYGNQLAVMLELLNLAKSTHAMARSALISSLVAQAQSSETIAALGLPTVTKTIPIQTDDKIEHLPFKGVSPHRSISQEIATCTANVGIVLGQLL